MAAILSIEDVFNLEFGVDKEDFIAMKTLDKRPDVIIVIFTAYRGRENAAKQARDRQASPFKATWHAQSPPSGRAPSLVRRQRFLRPGRQQRATNPEIIKEIDRLVEHNTYSQIASLLNERDMRSGEGKMFTPRIIARIRKQYGLTPRYDRLRKGRHANR
jgi:hypothetical protein